MYLIISKIDKTFWYKLVISSIEVYDKQIKPIVSRADKGMICKMPCNNLYLSHTGKLSIISLYE